jgi:hypothetical protein
MALVHDLHEARMVLDSGALMDNQDLKQCGADQERLPVLKKKDNHDGWLLHLLQS